VLFVSVNQTFEPGMSLAALEPRVAQAWAITVAKAASCDRVVAVYEATAVAAWRLRGAYPTAETYSTTGGDRARIALSLGEPLPVLPEYHTAPILRRGSATAELDDVAPLTPEPVEHLSQH
jgi:hypothetical protein